MKKLWNLIIKVAKAVKSIANQIREEVEKQIKRLPLLKKLKLGWRWLTQGKTVQEIVKDTLVSLIKDKACDVLYEQSQKHLGFALNVSL